MCIRSCACALGHVHVHTFDQRSIVVGWCVVHALGDGRMNFTELVAYPHTLFFLKYESGRATALHHGCGHDDVTMTPLPPFRRLP